MKSDISRTTFHPTKHYSAVRLQQGRVQMDADFNEQTDILIHQQRNTNRNTFGPDGVPLAGGGFEIMPDETGTNLNISSGRLYLNGTPCENENQVLFDKQPDLPGALLPLEDGNYLAYLEVWERNITALEDPEIREIALGGLDTSHRRKTVWQVRLMPTDESNLHTHSEPNEWKAKLAHTPGRLCARSVPDTVSTDPCDFGARGGYSLPDNRLYRVEIHKRGPAGDATYKWSRNNGILVTEWLEQNQDWLIVRSTGLDETTRFETGKWLEITDERLELEGRPGTLARILQVQGESIQVDLQNLLHFDESITSLDIKDFSNGRRKIRLWDMAANAGALPLPPEGDWLNLEQGIQIKFDPATTPKNREYESGDFWIIPARAATQNIQWECDALGPLLQEPQGNQRSYTRLAFLNRNGENWTKIADCRRIIPSLNDITLSYGGGDGQKCKPGESLASPLTVRVSRGPVGVPDVDVVFETDENGLLKEELGAGLGDSQTTLKTNGDGYVRVIWTPASERNKPHQLCRVTLKDIDVGEIKFACNLSLTEEISYEPTHAVNDGATLPESTTQSALDELFDAKVNRRGDTITGDLNVDQNLKVSGNLTVEGDMIVRDTQHTPGDVILGDNDLDNIQIHGVISSKHSTEALETKSALHMEHDSDSSAKSALSVQSKSDGSFALDVGMDSGQTNLISGAEVDSNKSDYKYKSTRGAARLGLHDGELNLYTGASTGLAEEIVNWKRGLHLNSEGLLSVGESAPLAKLYVNTNDASTSPLRVDATVRTGLSGWNYRKPITLSNSGPALQNFQIKLNIHFEDTKMQSDFADVRFTDDDARSVLNYWRETYTDSDNANFWVKIPELPTGNTLIYLYYGNPDALYEGDGNSVFIFFDDFSEGLEGWKFENSATRQDTRDSISGMYISIPTSSDGYLGTEVYHETSLPSAYTIESNLKSIPSPGKTVYPGGLLIVFQDTGHWLGLEGYEDGDEWTERGVYRDRNDTSWLNNYTPNIIKPGWQTQRVEIPGDDTYRIFINDDFKAQHPIPPFAIDWAQNGIGFAKHTIYGDLFIRHVFVREYAETEPTALFDLEQPAQALENKSVLTIQPETGYVGIGVNNPSEKLSVSGLVESTSGGFKFPDGSVQTTAWKSNIVWSEIAGNLTTDAPVGIGVSDPQEKLEVDGHILGTAIMGSWFPSTDGTSGSPNTPVYIQFDQQLELTAPSYFTNLGGPNGIRVEKSGYYNITLVALLLVRPNSTGHLYLKSNGKTLDLAHGETNRDDQTWSDRHCDWKGHLEAGQVITAYVYHQVATTHYYNGSNVYTRLTIHRIT